MRGRPGIYRPAWEIGLAMNLSLWVSFIDSGEVTLVVYDEVKRFSRSLSEQNQR